MKQWFIPKAKQFKFTPHLPHPQSILGPMYPLNNKATHVLLRIRTRKKNNAPKIPPDQDYRVKLVHAVVKQLNST